MERYQEIMFDADTHIYERPDAWTRHLPEAYKGRFAVEHRKKDNGNLALFIGDIEVTTSDGYMKYDERGEQLIPRPGSLKEFLRSMKSGNAQYQFVHLTEDMLSKDARIAKLDEFNVEACMLYPGEHNSIPGYLEGDALHVVQHAYNQYLVDEWGGFNYKNRIHLTPVIPLENLELAVREVEYSLANGARAVMMPLGPVGGRAPADPYFDPVWSRLNEAHAIVTYHIGEAKHMHPTRRQWGEIPLASRQKQSAWMWLNCYGQVPLTQTLSSLIFYNLFGRFRNLKVLSAENGAEWVPQLRISMDQVRGMSRNGYWPCGQLKERPSQIFNRHVYVVAYPEDDLQGIVERTEYCGNLLMGSDYPHSEGVPEPAVFVEACKGLDAAQIRGIMYENGKRMMGEAV